MWVLFGNLQFSYSIRSCSIFEISIGFFWLTASTMIPSHLSMHSLLFISTNSTQSRSSEEQTETLEIKHVQTSNKTSQSFCNDTLVLVLLLLLVLEPGLNVSSILIHIAAYKFRERGQNLLTACKSHLKRSYYERVNKHIKQGMSPPMISSFNQVQGKRGNNQFQNLLIEKEFDCHEILFYAR